MASSSDLERFNLQLPASLKRRIERVAERRGRSVAALVRSALEDYLRREEDLLFVAELRESYGAVRAEDLEMVEALEGTEAPVEEGTDGTSTPRGRLSGERSRSNRLRSGSSSRTLARRRPARKRPK